MQAVAEQIRAVRDLPEPMNVIVGVNSVRLATVAGTVADGINVRMSNRSGR